MYQISPSGSRIYEPGGNDKCNVCFAARVKQSDELLRIAREAAHAGVQVDVRTYKVA